MKTIFNLQEGAEGLFLAKFAQSNTVLHIARGDQRMHDVAASLKFFAPNVQMALLPAWDCLPYDRISPASAVINQRIETLALIASGKTPPIILTTINALLQRMPPRAFFKNASLHLEAGQSIARANLLQFLTANGYTNAGTASDPGEYALRGSIVDIIPAGSQEGMRLDFFGDTLESIKRFDPLTQITEGKKASIQLHPASEVPGDRETIERFRMRYRELFGASIDDPLYQAVSEGRKYTGQEHWLPLFHESLETIFDYVPAAKITLDPNMREVADERLKLIADHYQSRIETRAEGGYQPLKPELLYLQDIAVLESQDTISFSSLNFPEGKDVEDAAVRPAPNLREGDKFEALIKEAADKSTLIACFSEGSKARILHMLENRDMPTRAIENWQQSKALPKGLIGLTLFPLERGFEVEGRLIFSEQDVLGERVIRKKPKNRLTEKFLREASALQMNELVVHQEHGIGRFEGLETLSVANEKHDCLRLIYEGGDRLFVPVENIEVITRFGGEDGTALDKLGGVSWQKRKAVVKQRIKMAAEELMKTAALRAVQKAESFLAPEKDYEAFCAKFPYVETDDQLRAIEEIQNDLTSEKPMDRLVCGDVGFGKTEVALRAAFIAANYGQVALVTPTTLLCRQHFKTFKERFAGFGFRIAQLSRMVTASEAADTRQKLASGEIDIVIGTHALLGKTVSFKKLSLLIIDEEQHFGVRQKEALKNLRGDTHVLTLTATPIPRTLQLSLSGVRDLSLITTPPVDRLAVRTFVMPFDPMIIREALLREFYRGGRSFYVAPRVSDLSELEKKLHSLVPELKIGIAHGQMAPADMDEVMNKFYDGAFDLLLSTTIIESGIDIPIANTMVIHRADMFGLAQLYQLRGRVGRSKNRAYAYLTLPPQKIPSKEAMKRLEVMQRLDTLGAGFQLASYDMDIRGFGNLLGEEQSGTIKEVGAELYQQMLEEAVESLKGTQSVSHEYSPQINLGASVLIPENYVSDLTLRLSLYRRIGEVKTAEESESIAAEMIDRFGPLPLETQALLEVVKFKLTALRCHIEKIEAGPKGAVITFRTQQFNNLEALLRWIQANPITHKLRPDQKLVIANQNWESIPARFAGVRRLLEEIERL